MKFLILTAFFPTVGYNICSLKDVRGELLIFDLCFIIFNHPSLYTDCFFRYSLYMARFYAVTAFFLFSAALFSLLAFCVEFSPGLVIRCCQNEKAQISQSKEGHVIVWPLFNIQALMMTEEEELLEMYWGVGYLDIMRCESTVLINGGVQVRRSRKSLIFL